MLVELISRRILKQQEGGASVVIVLEQLLREIAAGTNKCKSPHQTIT